MIEIGKWNDLKVIRSKDFGIYLGEEDSSTAETVLLPRKQVPEGVKAGAFLGVRFSLTRFHLSVSLCVPVRDSINPVESLYTDSLKKVSDQKDNKISKDSLQKVDDLKDNKRISPEEINRSRSVTPEKKP